MLTVKEYLENIVNILNSKSDKDYVIKYFEHPINYGSESEGMFTITSIEEEKVIAITTSDFDVKNMFQGYLCYPYEYMDFYSEWNFILCFGPSDSLSYDEIMNHEVTDIDLYKKFYGLKNFENLLEKNAKVLSKSNPKHKK